MTDSEQVPWGKGEKQPGEGDEIVSETVYLQGDEALTAPQLGMSNAKLQISKGCTLCISFDIWYWKFEIPICEAVGNVVPIEEWPNELTYIACLSPSHGRRRSESEG